MTAPGWWYKTPNNQLVCAPPKCGLISLKISLTPGLPEKVRQKPDLKVAAFTDPYLRENGIGFFTDEEVIQWFPDEPRYMAVRDPVTRFQSLWHDKCVEGTDKDLAGLSPDQLMDRIAEYPMGNHHWMPQWCCLIPGTTLVRFDVLHRTLGIPEVHAHKSQHPWQLDKMPIDRIIPHYSMDVALAKQVGAMPQGIDITESANDA